MILAVYLPLLLPVLVVPVLRLAVDRLHPAWAAGIVTGVATVSAGCAAAALGMLAIAALSLLGPFDRLGHLSPESMRRLDAIHAPIDVVASVVLVVVLGSACRAAVRRIRVLRAARATAGAGPLLVLREDRPRAHAVPGRPGRIVVSTGMLRLLTAVERRALLAHEQAHLTGVHHRYVLAVDIAAALNPLLRPLTGMIRFATERWADEAAAGVVANRSVVARAVGKAALATREAPGPGVVLAATAGPVPRRVAALFGPAPRRHPVPLSLAGLVLAVVAVLLLGSTGFALDAAIDLHRVVELSQY